MRISVKRLRAKLGLIGAVHAAVLFAFFAFSVTFADGAWAEPNGPELIAPPVDELDRWVPSISIDMGLMIQQSSAGLVTGVIKGPWVQSFPAVPRIRQSASGTDNTFAPTAAVSLEFMTRGLRSIPMLPEIKIPGAPRLFVHGDAIASFTQPYRTAKNGDVDDFELGFTANAGINNEQIILGQGATAQSRVQRWQYSAGVGIAITTDLLGRRLRIKPSFEWFTQEVEFKGTVQRAAATDPQPRSFDGMRLIVLTDKTTKRFHGIGGGVELEFDTKRAGPLMVSMFGMARVYRFMGDLTHELSDINTYGEEARFRFELKRYTYRTSIGIRLRFAPE